MYSFVGCSIGLSIRRVGEIARVGGVGWQNAYVRSVQHWAVVMGCRYVGCKNTHM